MLYISGALISGSTALKVISGKNFKPSDLDLVVSPLGEVMVDIFLQTKGYSLVMHLNTEADSYLMSGLPGLCLHRYVCGQ